MNTFQDRLIKEITQLINVSKHSKIKTDQYRRWIKEIETNEIKDSNLKSFLDSKSSFISNEDLDYSLYLMKLSE